MTTPTYRGEVALLDWGHTRSSGAYVKLQLHPDDMRDGHPFLGLEKGERFAVVIAPFVDEPEPAPAEKPRRRWDELPLSQQAALRCGDARVWPLLPGQPATPDEAAQIVRMLCGVKSRAELNTNARAAARWREIDADIAQRLGLIAEER